MPIPSLYEPNPENDLILQGDVFPEIEFFLGHTSQSVSTSLSIGSAHNPLTLTASTSPSAVGGELPLGVSLPKVEKKLAAIISQTCDIADSDNVLVSPIYTMEEYLQKYPQNGQNNIRLIENRKGLMDKFYLGSLQVSNRVYKNCYIDLKVINTVSKNIFSIPSRIVSLSHWGRHLLNHQLAWLLGRPVINWSK